MEDLDECDIDIDERTSSLKPSNRDEDDQNTVSTLNDSTLDQGDQSGDCNNNDLPMVQRIESTLSDSLSMEESSGSVRGHLTTPRHLHPEPWHSVATQTILQKLHSEYQRQRMRLGELRSRNDVVLAGMNWKRNLYAKDFKFRILTRRIAELQAKNQELMKQQVNQGVLQQKLEAAQRQIKILQAAWNQTLDLHMAELDLSDDFYWQPLLPPAPNARPNGRQRHGKHLHQPIANSTATPQVIDSEISQNWQQDATATAVPFASHMANDFFAPPLEGRHDAMSLEKPENEQDNAELQRVHDTPASKDAFQYSKTLADPMLGASPAGRPNTSTITAIHSAHREEDVTTQLQAEITSLHATSTAQKVEMAKISYEFLQDKARRDREFASHEEKHNHALAQIQQLQSEKVQLLQDKQLMKSSLGQYESSISTLCKKQSNLFLELEEKTMRLDKAEQEIVRLDALVQQQRQESLCLQDQVYTQQQELMDIVQLKESNENLSTHCQALEKSLSQSSQHVSHLESVISQLQAKLQEAQKSNSRMKAENERITRECQETKRKHQIKAQKPHDDDCIREVHAGIFGFW